MPYELASYLGPYGETPHLFAVMNDPCKDGLCMTIMMSTIKADRSYDTTCVLNPGDHSFIVKPTQVVYRLATTMRADHINNMMAKHIYVQREDWLPAVFNQIAAGIHASDNISQGMVRYAVENNI